MTDETVLVLFKMKKRSLFDSEIENASMNVFLRDENGEPWTKVEQSHQIYHLGGSVNESSSLSAGNFSSDSALGNIRRPNQDRALYDADVSAPESLSWITETTNESTRRRNELQLIRRERHQRNHHSDIEQISIPEPEDFSSARDSLIYHSTALGNADTVRNRNQTRSLISEMNDPMEMVRLCLVCFAILLCMQFMTIATIFVLKYFS